MKTIKDLGQEYLDTAFNLRIRLEELKLKKKEKNFKITYKMDMERRIDSMYKEILYLEDVGNKLLKYYD